MFNSSHMRYWMITSSKLYCSRPHYQGRVHDAINLRMVWSARTHHVRSCITNSSCIKTLLVSWKRYTADPEKRGSQPIKKFGDKNC